MELLLIVGRRIVRRKKPLSGEQLHDPPWRAIAQVRFAGTCARFLAGRTCACATDSGAIIGVGTDSSHWTHAPWAQALAPYIPYAIGCWLFFMITTFHAALLRSQEELHISIVES
jgi:hypothetical protein